MFQKFPGIVLLSLVLLAATAAYPQSGSGDVPLNLYFTTAERAASLVRAGKDELAQLAFSHALDAAADIAQRSLVVDKAASAYVERGERRYSEKNYAKAIADYSTALQYDPENATALSDRAYSLVASAQCELAEEDADALLVLNPYSAEKLFLHGFTHECNLDFARAIFDYGRAISFQPNSATAFGYRGRARAIMGDYAGAERDLGRALMLGHGGLSSALWLHIVHARTGRPDPAWLKRFVRDKDLSHWPGPAIAFMLGNKTADEIVTFALNSPETDKAYQRCDGWFYAAQNELLNGRTLGVKENLRKTVEGCNPLDYEWSAAAFELKRLK